MTVNPLDDPPPAPNPQQAVAVSAVILGGSSFALFTAAALSDCLTWFLLILGAIDLATAAFLIGYLTGPLRKGRSTAGASASSQTEQSPPDRR